MSESGIRPPKVRRLSNPVPSRRKSLGIRVLVIMMALSTVIMACVVMHDGGKIESDPPPSRQIEVTPLDAPSDSVAHMAVSWKEKGVFGPEDPIYRETPAGEAQMRTAEPVSVSIAEVGDVLMHSRVIDSGRTGDGYDFRHLFAEVSEEIGKSDIRAVNQETPIAGEKFGYSGYPSFNAPFDVGDAEADMGMNLILKATNHSFDQGYDGIREELGLWATRHPDIPVIGVADPDGDGVCPAGGCSPAGPYVYEANGLRIAFLNYTSVLNTSIDDSRDPAVLAMADEGRIRSDVRWAKAKGRADAVIVFMHWGEEYMEQPTDSQRQLAELLLELGVDAVIGGHAHVIQPIDVMEGRNGHKMVVFWSTGNFTSTQTNNRNMIGLLARITVTKDGNGTRVSSYEALPTVTHRAVGKGFATYLLRDYTDELSKANRINEVDPEGFSVEWCQQYCRRILGEGYDTESKSLTGVP